MKMRLLRKIGVSCLVVQAELASNKLNMIQYKIGKKFVQSRGLNPQRITNGPTAAAIAKELEKKGAGERNELIYEMDGGFCDAPSQTTKKGIFKAKATDGDTHLGEEDLDNRIINSSVQDFNHGKDMADQFCSLSRDSFDDYFRNSMEPAEKYMRDSGTDKKNVHDALTVDSK